MTRLLNLALQILAVVAIAVGGFFILLWMVQ